MSYTQEPYTKEEAKNLVIKAGLRLVEEKLIARTWGNISARISDKQFVITPSGRSYESLKPSDLVVVNIEDCSYLGDIKPSSEKGIHASAYKLRPDVNFVIHTHQLYATAISVLGADATFAPCAKYGLPGTGKLRKNVESAVSLNPSSKAFLMERHGAFCLGSDYEDAFKVAEKLEAESLELFVKQTASVKPRQCNYPFLDDYAQIMGFGNTIPDNEDDETIRLITEKNRAAALFASYKHGMNVFDVLLQHIVYKKKYSKLKGKA